MSRFDEGWAERHGDPYGPRGGRWPVKPANPEITLTLVTALRWCNNTGHSFNKSLAEARKIYAREVREKALKG